MNKQIFTNNITVTASTNHIRGILLNLNNILKWDPEIAEVSPIDTNEFMILRHGGAINKVETIRVTISDQKIQYEFFDGKIPYRIIWETLPLENGKSEISQTLLLDNQSTGFNIAKLIRPVIQSAFMENLTGLKRIVESGVEL